MQVASAQAPPADDSGARHPGEAKDMEQLVEEFEALLAAHRIRYVSAEDLNIYRQRCGRGFLYRDGQ